MKKKKHLFTVLLLAFHYSQQAYLYMHKETETPITKTAQMKKALKKLTEIL